MMKRSGKWLEWQWRKIQDESNKAWARARCVEYLSVYPVQRCGQPPAFTLIPPLVLILAMILVVILVIGKQVVEMMVDGCLGISPFSMVSIIEIRKLPSATSRSDIMASYPSTWK